MSMTNSNKYDKIIRKYSLLYNVPAPLIKAMIRKESNWNPLAVSHCGAIGLMQIMPTTARHWHIRKADLFDADKNIGFGVFYIRFQYDHFPEIPDPIERWKFALASYNGGRGYVNRALQLARKAEGKKIKEDGEWQNWTFTKEFLKPKECKVFGRKPDWKQIINYVYVIIIWANTAADSLVHPEEKNDGKKNK